MHGQLHCGHINAVLVLFRRQIRTTKALDLKGTEEILDPSKRIQLHCTSFLLFGGRISTKRALDFHGAGKTLGSRSILYKIRLQSFFLLSHFPNRIKKKTNKIIRQKRAELVGMIFSTFSESSCFTI